MRNLVSEGSSVLIFPNELSIASASSLAWVSSALVAHASDAPPGCASISPSTPCHDVQRSASEKNEKTVAGEAGIRRVTTTRHAVPLPCERLERVDLLPRRTRGMLQRAEPLLIRAIETLFPLRRDRHESGVTEKREMLGDTSVAEVEPLDELADG